MRDIKQLRFDFNNPFGEVIYSYNKVEINDCYNSYMDCNYSYNLIICGCNRTISDYKHYNNYNNEELVGYKEYISSVGNSFQSYRL